MTMRLWYLALGSLLSLALAGLGHDLRLYCASGTISPVDLVGELLLAFLAGVLGTSLALLLVLARRGVAC